MKLFSTFFAFFLAICTLNSIAQDAENIKNVSFLGYKSGEDLHSEISRSAFAVVPSECYENNPLSILEAFALGKPVIGARIGGIPELVKDGQTGYTFESGNVRDLQEKIEALSKMRSDITEMGRTARQFVEKEFNPEIHYQRLMEVYQAILAGTSAIDSCNFQHTPERPPL